MHVVGPGCGNAKTLTGDGGVGVQEHDLLGPAVEAVEKEGDIQQGSGAGVHEPCRNGRRGRGGTGLPEPVPRPVAQLSCVQLEEPTADLIIVHHRAGGDVAGLVRPRAELQQSMEYCVRAVTLPAPMRTT
jgi:hypothetical protein